MTGADARIVQLLKEARETLSAERKRRTEPLSCWDASALIDPDASAPGKGYTKRGAFLGQVTNSEQESFGISRGAALGMARQQRPRLEAMLTQSFLHGLALGRDLAAFAFEEQGTPPSGMEVTSLSQGENGRPWFGTRYLDGAAHGANLSDRLGSSLDENFGTVYSLVDYLAGAESTEVNPAASTAPSPLPTGGEADGGDLEDEIARLERELRSRS